jgi:GDP-4-dehydro-6-deoxy-D-mannose reductase
VRAVITGAAGFVGRHLAASLSAAGDHVASIDRDHDVTDFDATAEVLAEERPDAIYHLAALSHVGASWDDPGEVLRVNVMGTHCVLAAARATVPSATVLAVSSAEVYGTVAPHELPIAETAELRPGSPYAASKEAAEVIARQAALGFGQRVVIVRPFNHIGPGQSPMFFVSAVARRLAEARSTGQRDVTVGSLSVRRDFTDVRDVVRAYRLLIERGAPGEVYNVCSGIDVSIADVADRLRELVYPQAVFVEDVGLSRPQDMPILRGDPSKLRTTTGWTPKIQLEATLRDVVQEVVLA